MTGLGNLEQWGTENNEAEIWWDSCPMSYQRWRNELISSSNHPKIAEVLDRLFDHQHGPGGLLKGVTTNPNLVMSEITANPETWETVLKDFTRASPSASVEDAFEYLYHEVIKQSAQALLPSWETSNGKHGWVSAQIDPRLMFDSEAMIQQGLRLSQIAPNVMVKVPGTQQGYQTIEELTAQLISTNGTFSFTVPQVLACARAVHLGLKRALCVNLSPYTRSMS
jgi:transaldolase